MDKFVIKARLLKSLPDLEANTIFEYDKELGEFTYFPYGQDYFHAYKAKTVIENPQWFEIIYDGNTEEN